MVPAIALDALPLNLTQLALAPAAGGGLASRGSPLQKLRR
jgi:hypothetical protein